MKFILQILREKRVQCQCGKKRHYKDAEFCSRCGKKLKKPL